MGHHYPVCPLTFMIQRGHILVPEMYQQMAQNAMCWYICVYLVAVVCPCYSRKTSGHQSVYQRIYVV